MVEDPTKSKPSPMSRILSRFSNRAAGRHRSPVKNAQPHKDTQPTRNPPDTQSKESPFRRVLNRVSFSKKHRVEISPIRKDSSQDSLLNNGFCHSPSSREKDQKWLTSSPRPALSETDLRHVTVRRGTDMQSTPLAGAPQFMSEDNLATADCGTPVKERVPSYIKISCTLNGYRSPRAAIENTPIRPAGKSLIERRLAQLRGSPLCNTETRRCEQLTSTGIADTSMGSTCSSPSVKNLIGQFDRWKLCVDEADSLSDAKENIKPSNVICQPGVEKPLKDVCAARASTSKTPAAAADDSPASMSVESTPVESTTSSARSGGDFAETVSTTRRGLEEKSQLAQTDLENVQNMPEAAADSIRMATGKAALLIRKKLTKFDELVRANMHPETSDKVTTTEDLEGYWALVELELTDINGIFLEVENWRSRNYEPVPEDSPDAVPKHSEANNNVAAKKIRVAPKPTTAPKPLSEKQKLAAEQRKKAMAEARQRAREQKEKEAARSPDGVMVL